MRISRYNRPKCTDRASRLEETLRDQSTCREPGEVEDGGNGGGGTVPTCVSPFVSFEMRTFGIDFITPDDITAMDLPPPQTLGVVQRVLVHRGDVEIAALVEHPVPERWKNVCIYRSHASIHSGYGRGYLSAPYPHPTPPPERIGGVRTENFT